MWIAFENGGNRTSVRMLVGSRQLEATRRNSPETFFRRRTYSGQEESRQEEGCPEEGSEEKGRQEGSEEEGDEEESDEEEGHQEESGQEKGSQEEDGEEEDRQEGPDDPIGPFPSPVAPRLQRERAAEFRRP
jgi:hypothetical protein